MKIAFSFQFNRKTNGQNELRMWILFYENGL